MTSLIPACGRGRSTSFIPAVPAAWSVTTIAFMIFSSVVLSRAPTRAEIAPERQRQRFDASRLLLKTVPRSTRLAVPSRDGSAPHPPRSCTNDPADRPDLFGDPRGHRERTARFRRAFAVLAGSLGPTLRLPRHRACGLRTADRRAIRDRSGAGRDACGRATVAIDHARLGT